MPLNGRKQPRHHWTTYPAQLQELRRNARSKEGKPPFEPRGPRTPPIRTATPGPTPGRRPGPTIGPRSDHWTPKHGPTRSKRDRNRTPEGRTRANVTGRGERGSNLDLNIRGELNDDLPFPQNLKSFLVYT